MHSHRHMDRQQYDANSRSYCITVWSAKNGSLLEVSPARKKWQATAQVQTINLHIIYGYWHNTSWTQMSKLHKHCGPRIYLTNGTHIYTIDGDYTKTTHVQKWHKNATTRPTDIRYVINLWAADIGANYNALTGLVTGQTTPTWASVEDVDINRSFTSIYCHLFHNRGINIHSGLSQSV